MKIVAGLGCVDDYIRLVKAGADEFFCGYVPYQWTKKYGVMLPLNRREVLYYNVQIGSLEELRILKKMVDKYQVPVKITFNSLFYLEEQYELIRALICECMEVGFDTFIIADVALLLYLRKKKIDCKIHLSGETAEVNHLMMEVLNQFDIKRYIFHRKNTIEDMKSCIEKNPVQGLEYEAFVLNEWCHFTGGYCNSLHCDELVHLCKVPYQMGKVRKDSGRFEGLISQRQQELDDELSDGANEEAMDELGYEVNNGENGEVDMVSDHRVKNKTNEEADHESNCEGNHYTNEGTKIEAKNDVIKQFDYEVNNQANEKVHKDAHEDSADEEDTYWRDEYITGSTGCGLCALMKLKKAGVTHLKLVGRGNYVDYMERDIKQLKHAIQLVELNENESDYVNQMKQELFQHGCSDVCYYRGEL